MQPLIARLSEPGAVDNRVYDLLLQDYINYHAVLVVGGSVFAMAAFYVTARSIRALAAGRANAGSPAPVVARRANLVLAITGAVTGLLMLLLVAINLSTVLSPREGFTQTFAEAAARSRDAENALSWDTLLTWIQTGDERLPPRLQAAVNERLSWQRPKAIVCWILLALSALLTTRAWNAINEGRQRKPARTGLGRAVLLASAIAGISVCLILVVLAFVNTQAWIAPIVITLAAG